MLHCYIIFVRNKQIKQKESFQKSTIMKELGQRNFVLGKTADTKAELETNFTSKAPSEKERLLKSFISYSAEQEKGWL